MEGKEAVSQMSLPLLFFTVLRLLFFFLCFKVGHYGGGESNVG